MPFSRLLVRVRQRQDGRFRERRIDDLKTIGNPDLDMPHGSSASKYLITVRS